MSNPGWGITLAALLSKRQTEVLAGRERGESVKEIAARLGLSRHTVKHHITRILRKLDATSSAEAVYKRSQNGQARLD